jgi:hypothetical protein
MGTGSGRAILFYLAGELIGFMDGSYKNFAYSMI